MDRRRFLAGAFGLAVTSAVAAPPPVKVLPAEFLSEREEIVVRDLASRGVNKLLLMDKKIGRLRAVADGKILFSVPAISSVQPGDTWETSPGATPAGIFPLLITEGQQDIDAAMCFAELNPGAGLDMCRPGTGNLGYVIHKTVNSRRTTALSRVGHGKADAPLRLSAGCIVLDVASYARISQFAQASTQTLNSREGAPVLVNHSFLVTMPEKTNIEETRQFFGIPAPL